MASGRWALDEVPSPHFALPWKYVQGGGPLLAGAPRKTVSGLSADDMAILHSLTPEELARTADQPSAALRRHWVVLALDSDHCLPEVVASLGALRDALAGAGEGMAEGVGVGVLSMLGFDSTRNALRVRCDSAGGRVVV
jgi:hypothetical protein